MVLDDRRLGKQRLEARQLLDTLKGNSEAYANHPCTKMWRGHEWWLAEYGVAMCMEWIKRGFRDEMLPEFLSFVRTREQTRRPAFLDNELLHSSMRANLVRKDPMRYKGFLGFKEEPADGYAWPT